MKKHAFLIMAHKVDETFYTLIKLLDDKNNDIFIHMDKKNSNYDEEKTINMIKKSNIYHIDRKSVAWGGYSMIDVEVDLLNYAINKNHYIYYHLLSGEDLPIKSNYYIHNFFEENSGKNFVRFQDEKFKYNKRVKVFYPLQEKLGRKYKVITKLLAFFQMCLPYRRNKNIIFQKGDNWFSITDDLARYVVQKKDWIKRTFASTCCCDEIFLQTLIINSSFKDTLYVKIKNNELKGFMRFIDWDRGNPYVFRKDDFKLLIQSDMLFARKFNCNVDKEIIDLIYEHVKNKNEEGEK